MYSLHRQTLLLVGSHAASVPFGTVFLHLYTLLLLVKLVLCLSSRLTCSQDICIRSAVRASNTFTGSFARYKFIIYLLNGDKTAIIWRGPITDFSPLLRVRCYYIFKTSKDRIQTLDLNTLLANFSIFIILPAAKRVNKHRCAMCKLPV